VPLPTDGFTTTSVTYSMATSDNLPVSITVRTDNASRRDAFEVFQPYLEAALNQLRADYASGTEQEVLYIERAYGAAMQDSLSSGE
jgi:ABC-type branched-subunit amino acid transport system ATPase component